MGRTTIRVLTVDDYEPWRRFTRLSLLVDAKLHIVGEAADGLQAVQKARELQPDLILLDIGLPGLNGMEAARIMREGSPNSKVIFVSENRSSEILQEAFWTGARGYVLKSDAGRELLPAITAVLEGKQFVSSSLGLRAGTLNRPQVQTGVARIAVENTNMPHRHQASFYSHDQTLVDDVTLFIGNALKAGNAAVVVATESHREKLLSGLQVFGVEIPSVIEQGRYLSFDAEEALAAFMFKGVLDPDRLLELFGRLIATAARTTGEGRSRVAIFGECVNLLWAGGNAEAAIQMEALGNELTRKYEVDILCGYSLAQGKMHADIHRIICEQHSAVHTL